MFGKTASLSACWPLQFTLLPASCAVTGAGITSSIHGVAGSKPSWTAKLASNQELLCSKIREEAGELCETLEKQEGQERAASEMADLLYHSMVLLNVQVSFRPCSLLCFCSQLSCFCTQSWQACMQRVALVMIGRLAGSSCNLASFCQ